MEEKAQRAWRGVMMQSHGGFRVPVSNAAGPTNVTPCPDQLRPNTHHLYRIGRNRSQPPQAKATLQNRPSP